MRKLRRSRRIAKPSWFAYYQRIIEMPDNLTRKLECPDCGTFFLRRPDSVQNHTLIQCRSCARVLGRWSELEAEFNPQGDGVAETDQAQTIRKRLAGQQRSWNVRELPIPNVTVTDQFGHPVDIVSVSEAVSACERKVSDNRTYLTGVALPTDFGVSKRTSRPRSSDTSRQRLTSKSMTTSPAVGYFWCSRDRSD